MALKQDNQELTKEQIDNMSQEDWDALPIVTGPKPGVEPSSIQLDLSDKSLPKGMNAKMDIPKLEAEKPKNNAIKITKGLLGLLSPATYAASSVISGAARSMYSKLNNK